MVNRQDIRNLNEEVSTLIDAVDELEELYEQSQKGGVTVDSSAYASAQQDVKDAVATLTNVSNDMVDRTGALEDDEGNELVSLPDVALERANATELPSTPANE